MSENRILTAEQVAEKLQVHVKTVYRNRDIPRVEIGPGMVRFIEADIDAWLRSKMTRKSKPEKRLRKARTVQTFLCDIPNGVNRTC